MTEMLIRAALLYVSMLLLIGAAWWRPPTRRMRNAAILACIWNIPALLMVHALATQLGWWQIESHGGAQMLGMPLDLLVGWMLFWGAVPLIAAPRAPLVLIVAVALGFDLWAMPRCAPLVTLGKDWLYGEALALAIVLIPAQLFGRWTRDNTHLATRATLQVICFAALTLWIVPTLAFEHLDAAGSGWAVLRTYDHRWLLNILQLFAYAALPGVSAVQEFVRRGQGTPVPFDPPRRLVTSGIYAYIANPMQVSAVLILLATGALLHNWWIAAASIVAVIYGSGIAAWDEERDLAERFGDRWTSYRREVHNWRPRWRPYIPADTEPARLYVAFTCGKCSEVGTWIDDQDPHGLRIVPAEQHPERDLWRITYTSPDGVEEEGVAAIARALEHIHLAWALIGMFLRLPVIRAWVQIIVDLTGGGPQHIERTCVPPV